MHVEEARLLYLFALKSFLCLFIFPNETYNFKEVNDFIANRDQCYCMFMNVLQSLVSILIFHAKNLGAYRVPRVCVYVKEEDLYIIIVIIRLSSAYGGLYSVQSYSCPSFNISTDLSCDLVHFILAQSLTCLLYTSRCV